MRWTAILTIAFAGPALAASPDAIGQASGAALQADARHALDLIKDVDPATLSDKDAKFVTCMRARFASASTSKSASAKFADRVLALYQTYWHSALTHPERRQAEERRLEASLRRFLRAPKAADLDELLAKRLTAAGWHSLEGRTGLLLELMMWGKQDETTVEVALPEGKYRVKVALLDGFKSFGWSYYATCGRASTGGWTTDEALFAVVPRYDSLDDEEFRVTFLSHEAQHFADNARFKALKPWELEYRAKLVEVALANKTRAKVLTRFVEDQGDDPASPHSYANRKILTELVKRLGLVNAKDLYTVDLAHLQSTARDVLLEDSRARAAASPASTQK